MFGDPINFASLNFKTCAVKARLRMKDRLTLMYKLSHNLININTDKYLVLHTKMHTHGSHLFKYRAPTTKKDVFKFSYFSRTINERNSLPEQFATSDSLDIFKANLSSYF